MPTSTSYTVNGILQSLGYVDPMMAARQQARMILMGRQARYQAEIQQLESKWGLTLAQIQQKYQQESQEDFAADDDYLQWQWYADTLSAIEAQLEIIKTPQLTNDE